MADNFAVHVNTKSPNYCLKRISVCNQILRKLLGFSQNEYTVNSLQDGHLWDRHLVSVLERCLSYKESNKGNKQRQGITLGVRFTEVSVKRESTVHCTNNRPFVEVLEKSLFYF